MAQVITVGQCGDLLASFVGNRTSAEEAKALAKTIGYNDSPLFGQRAKRTKLVSELVMLYSALVIFAANQAFNQATAKAVIDSFLSNAKRKMFVHLEKEVPSFSKLYSERMGEYFPIFQQDKAALGLSFSLMQNLGLNPLKSLHGQLALTAKISALLNETLKVMKGFTVIGLPTPPADSEQSKKQKASQAVDEFMAATASWNGPQKIAAITIVGAALQGNGAAVEPLMKDLSIDQVRVVTRLLDKLEE